MTSHAELDEGAAVGRCQPRRDGNAAPSSGGNFCDVPQVARVGL